MEIDNLPAPREVIRFGHEAAKFLKEIISTQKDKVLINGRQYLQFHDWQTIAKFYKHSVSVEWTKSIAIDGKIMGYEARAIVINNNGQVVSSAESSCGRDEQLWSSRKDFQIRSMAQTRACVKALRNVFSWVMVLAGYEPMAAEEMDEKSEAKQVNPQFIKK